MTTRKRKPNRVPPARVRYEATHPTVSIRVGQELKEELDELKQMPGLSMADTLEAGLDRLKPDVEEFYERGLSDGYDIAEEEFKVFATCHRCRRPHLPVISVKMKEAVARAVIGWGGTSCQ